MVLREGFDDPAIIDDAALTAGGQPLQLRFQGPELTKSPSYLGQLRCDFGIHLGAGGAGLIGEPQQVPDVVQTESQATAAPYEQQTVAVPIIVDPVPARRPRGRRQQSLTLVVADGDGFGVGSLGQLPMV